MKKTHWDCGGEAFMKYKIAWWVVGWRLLLSVVALVSIQFLPYKPSFPYSDSLLSNLGSRWLTAWANFDGVHYLTIVEKGYFGTGSIQAFFPLYPMLVAIVGRLGVNPVLAGVTLSTIFFGLALVILHKLIQKDWGKKVATRTVILLLLAPTAFFFTSLYTESLFLLLVVLAFYSAREGNFLRAGLVGVLAAMTKTVGVLLVPALLVELWQQKKKGDFHKKNWGSIAGSLLPAGGLGAYMIYLQKVFGDALLFLHAQPQFGAQREVDKLILPYQVFWRYAKMVATVEPASLTYYSVWLELVSAIVLLGLVIWAFYKTRRSYAVFAALALLVPTLTGTFTSLPRYLLVLFPVFVVLAQVLTGKKYVLALVISGILLIINTMLFIQGYWIA